MEEPEDVQQMRKELTETTSQLVQKSSELLNCKFDLQRHRQEIDVRFSFLHYFLYKINEFFFENFCRNLIRIFVT